MTGFWRRVRALTRKESIEIRRDPSSLMIGLVLPVLMVVLFGFGLSLDIPNVSLGVVIDPPSSSEGDRLRAGFALSRYFAVHDYTQFGLAERAFRAGQIDAIVRVQSDFARRAAHRDATVQLILNGSDPNKAHIIQGYVGGVVGGLVMRPPAIDLRARVWFNPANNSRDFLVPGLTAIIMTLTGAFLTVLVIAREWERGTFESLFATPVRIPEILIAKIVPYFVLGFGGFIACYVTARLVFDVPIRGSVLLLCGASAVYLIFALTLGLFISTLVKNSFLATQIAIIVSFLPALMLSGFLFDVHNLPPLVRAITEIVPARYYVTFLQTIFLAGDMGSVIISDIAALSGFTMLLLGCLFLATRKRLN